MLDPLNGTFLCVKGKSRSKVKFSRHPISDPPYQLHVRPRRLAGHVHAPNQGQEIGILRPCKQLVCPYFFLLYYLRLSFIFLTYHKNILFLPLYMLFDMKMLYIVILREAENHRFGWILWVFPNSENRAISYLLSQSWEFVCVKRSWSCLIIAPLTPSRHPRSHFWGRHIHH